MDTKIISNDLIIQWGQTDGTTTSVVFPMSFSSKLYAAGTVGSYNSSYNGCGYQNIKTGTIKKTGFEWITKVSNLTVRYIVVGI